MRGPHIGCYSGALVARSRLLDDRPGRSCTSPLGRAQYLAAVNLLARRGRPARCARGAEGESCDFSLRRCRLSRAVRTQPRTIFAGRVRKPLPPGGLSERGEVERARSRGRCSDRNQVRRVRSGRNYPFSENADCGDRFSTRRQRFHAAAKP